MGEEGIREAYRTGKGRIYHPLENRDRGHAGRQAANCHHGNSVSSRQVATGYGHGEHSYREES